MTASEGVNLAKRMGCADHPFTLSGNGAHKYPSHRYCDYRDFESLNPRFGCNVAGSGRAGGLFIWPLPLRS
jgi:hypothetical protein